MPVCDCGCGQEIGQSGRGEPRRFVSDAHRTSFHSEARRVGARTLQRRRKPKLSEEDRVKQAKDRAADQLARYNEKRRKEIEAGAPTLTQLFPLNKGRE